MALDKAEIRRLSVRFRTSAPDVLRRAYRIGRSLSERPLVSAALPDDLVEGCELLASRERLIERLPKGGVVVELGTQTGGFARRILDIAEPERLHVVDVDYSRFDPALLADPRLVRHQGLTHEVMETFEPLSFDWVYIDADHSYAGALRDARVSADRLKPGGLLVFNDFAHIDPELGRYGVHRAVTDFALENRWRLRYLALHPAALYDVALEKPR